MIPHLSGLFTTRHKLYYRPVKTHIETFNSNCRYAKGPVTPYSLFVISQHIVYGALICKRGIHNSGIEISLFGSIP